MSQFFVDYGLFLAKTLTVVAAVVVIIVAATAASKKGRESGGLIVKNLNDRFRELGDALRREVMPKSEFKAQAKEQKAALKTREKSGADDRKRMFVLDFHGDIKATGVAGLREEISAVIETPAKTVKSRLFTARQQLRRRLEARGLVGRAGDRF